MAIPAPFLCMLRCPATRQVLTEDQGWLVGPQSSQRYAVDEQGIPLFAERGVNRYDLIVVGMAQKPADTTC